MKAAVHDWYGSPDALELAEIDEPVVGDDGVLVRVRAASVNPYDWHVLTGLPFIGRLQMGFRPKVHGLGGDLAGQVEAVGTDVALFRPGDEVFGMVDGAVPGTPMLELGSFAEYVCVSEGSLAPKPANLTFEQAAAVPLAGWTALHAIRDAGKVQPEHRVLINGASGGVGTFAVQIATAFGAQVTGVCSSRNVDMVRSIGAAEVIDYTREDFTSGTPQYDLLLDNVGNRSLSDCRHVLKPEGTYLASFGRPENRWLGPFARLIGMRLASPFVSQELVQLSPKRTNEVLLTLKELIEAGKVTPVIDRTYRLAETPDAIRYVGEAHARGKVVITV